MSGVPPAPPRPAAGLPAAPEAAVKGTLVSAPEALAELPAGSLLRGLVTGRGAAGSLVIATALGDLEVAVRVTPVALRTVLVQLPSGSGGTVVILPPPEEGPRAPAPLPARPAAGSVGATPEGRGPTAGPQDTVARQPAIAATVLAGPDPSEAAEDRPGAAVLRPGARIAVQVLSILSEAAAPLRPAGQPAAAPGGVVADAPPDARSIERPAPAIARLGGPAPAPPAPAAPAPGVPAQPAAAPGVQQAPPPAGPSAGQPAPIPAARSDAGAAPAPQHPLAARPESSVAGARAFPPPVDGRVTATTGDGRAVVTTPLGKLLLAPQTGLTAGDRVRLVVQLPEAGPLTAAADSVSRGWPALVEALAVLATEETAPAADSARSAGPSDLLPRTGPRLGSSLLFLISALSGGSLTAWLGNAAVESLERWGRAELVARLGQEFNQMSRPAEAPGGDWRLLALPIVHEGTVTPVHLYLRRKPARPADDSGARATRFVVELTLSRLGELQLDGLVTAERFDLILRSRRPLGSQLRSDITAIFMEANAITGAKGRIGFQNAADWAAIEPVGSHPARRRPNLVI